MKKTIIVNISILFFGLVAKADDKPNIGLLYNTKENSSLTYTCVQSEAVLKCEFVQVNVRKKANLEDLSKKLVEAKKQFPSALKDLSSENICAPMSIVLSVLEGKQAPEKAAENAPKDVISDKQKFIREMREMNETKKQETITYLKALNDFCSTRSEESFLRMTQVEHEKDMRTCAISTNSFKQNFRWLQDSGSGAGAWVVESKPEGPCGIVQLSRFEKSNSINKIVLWNYIAKKAITNPKGSLLPNISCSQLDQDEYIYSWKADRDYRLGCEYIEFSPL